MEISTEVIPKICTSCLSRTLSEWWFYLRISPNLNFDAFREFNLKETCKILVNFIAHIQISVLLWHAIL